MKNAEEVMDNFMQLLNQLQGFTSSSSISPLIHHVPQEPMGYTYDAVKIANFLNELDEANYCYKFSTQIKSNSIGPVCGEKIIKLGVDAQVRLNNGNAFFERIHDGKVVEKITLEDCITDSFPSELYQIIAQ